MGHPRTHIEWHSSAATRDSLGRRVGQPRCQLYTVVFVLKDTYDKVPRRRVHCRFRRNVGLP